MFYDLYESLCERKGISKHKAALDMGLSCATPTKWKKTGATPNGETLSKIAEYFDVTVSYLLTGENEQKEKAPSEGSLSEDEQKVLSIFEALPEDKKRDLLRIAEALLPPEAKS